MFLEHKIKIFLIILMFGLAAFALFFNSSDLTREDIQKAVANGEDLNGINLRELDLSGMNLAKTRFNKSFLAFVNFNETNLSGADLSEANLKNANLTGANLEGANLSKAKLNGADLSTAILFGKIFFIFPIKAFFEGAFYNDKTKFPDSFSHKEEGMVKSQ